MGYVRVRMTLLDQAWWKSAVEGLVLGEDDERSLRIAEEVRKIYYG